MPKATQPPPTPPWRRPGSLQDALALLILAGHPARLALILAIKAGAESHSDLGKAAGLKPTSVVHHLALLRLGGLAVRKRRGPEAAYELTGTGLKLARLARGLVGSLPTRRRGNRGEAP